MNMEINNFSNLAKKKPASANDSSLLQKEGQIGPDRIHMVPGFYLCVPFLRFAL